MPIRASEKARYPADWPAISARVRQRAGNACAFCGVNNGWLGGRDPTGRFHAANYLGCDRKLPAPGDWAWCGKHPERLRVIRIVLTVAHLDHQPENCADDNLKALCQRCHLAYDAAHHARTRAETRRKAIGNLDLFNAGG